MQVSCLYSQKYPSIDGNQGFSFVAYQTSLLPPYPCSELITTEQYAFNRILDHTNLCRLCLARSVCLFPVIVVFCTGSLTFLFTGGLLAMLCTWISKGEPYYQYMHATSQHIVYISDIGATSWGKPIFIATSAVTVVAFDLVFILERWLRHKRQLVQNYRKSEKILSILAIVWSIIGAAALILLTIFDTKNHNKVHDSMLGLFM